MLSDTAKRLLYRDRELDLLRMMVEQDIAAGDHESALRLVDELSEHFGRLEEAEAHRTRIGSLRRAEVETRIEEEMRSIRRLLEAGDWSGEPGPPSGSDGSSRRPGSGGSRPPGGGGSATSLDRTGEPHAGCHADGRIDEAMTLLRDLDRHLEERRPGAWSTWRRSSSPIGIFSAPVPGRRRREAVDRRRRTRGDDRPRLPEHEDGRGGRRADARPAAEGRVGTRPPLDVLSHPCRPTVGRILRECRSASIPPPRRPAFVRPPRASRLAGCDTVSDDFRTSSPASTRPLRSRPRCGPPTSTTPADSAGGSSCSRTPASAARRRTSSSTGRWRRRAGIRSCGRPRSEPSGDGATGTTPS